MSYTTTGSNTAHLWSYFNKMTLDVVKQKKVLVDIGDETPLPQGYGKQVIWTKVSRLPSITAATTEGTPPTPRAITSSQITAQVSQYKDAIGWTDLWEATNANERIEKELRERVSDQMATSLDIITRDHLLSSINTTAYVNDETALSNLSSSDSLSLSEVRQQKLVLEANNVGTHKSGYYVFVGHPNTIYDMKTDTGTGGWIDVHKYTDMGYKKLFNAEVGECDGIKFKSTTLVSNTATGTSGTCTAYYNMIFGYQPFGTTKLYTKGSKKSMSLIYHGPGSAGTADAVDELATLGWKAYYVPKYFGNVVADGSVDRAVILVSGRVS